MNAISPAPEQAQVTPTAAPRTPWFAGPLFHLVTGAVVLAAGFGLLHFGQATEGAAAIGSGLTFLGVGAGVSSSSAGT